MSVAEEVVKALQATFAREPRIKPPQYPVCIDFNDGNLTLDGAVEHVAVRGSLVIPCLACPA